MTGKRLYLVIQSAACVLLAALLAASAVGIDRDGAARRAEDPLAWVYTREIAAERLSALAPLLFLLAGTTAAGLLLGVRDERAGGPAKGESAPCAHGKAGNGRRMTALRAAVLAAAVALILAGIANGSARDVFYKAATI